ncbi:hypothetical protein LOTGIDRAFT_176459, partial [Lottia gigantea]
KIIIGSFHGILRIYNPHPKKTESGWSGFKTEDVIVEQAFQQPILQVEVGKFSSVTESNQLAVLHPRKLAVYSIKGEAILFYNINAANDVEIPGEETNIPSITAR